MVFIRRDFSISSKKRLSADGKTERLVHAHEMRYWFRYEVEHLLARCGLRVIERFGNDDKSPFTDNSPEMIFVAEKPAE